MKQLTLTTLIALLPMLDVQPSLAQAQDKNSLAATKTAPGYDLSLGLEVLSEASVYVGGKRSDQLIPIIEWAWEHWFFIDYRFGSYLAGDDNWYVATSLGMDSAGDADRDDSPMLSDLKKLDDVYTADLSVGFLSRWGGVEASLEQDISRGHQSHLVTLSYGYELRFGPWSFEPYISMQYLPSRVINYYYGVDQSEAKAGRPAYHASGAYTAEAGISTVYVLNNVHAFSFDMGYQQLSREIRDSPTVGREGIATISARYLYAF